MKEYTTTVMINAPPALVWGILVDGPRYRDWNPEIVGVDGRIDRGERITGHVRLGSGAIRHVALVVTAFDAPRRMEWRLGMPLGLFVGKRIFTVEPKGSGTQFRLHLEMSGPMLPLILKSVGDRQPEVDSFSAALKGRAESLGSQTPTVT
jgi:uncharacterized protein YndB with AHSA1/START domain